MNSKLYFKKIKKLKHLLINNLYVMNLFQTYTCKEQLFSSPEGGSNERSFNNQQDLYGAQQAGFSWPPINIQLKREYRKYIGECLTKQNFQK